ncbi:MAG: hypothetical protein AAF674_20840 [Pseudomonadota bacterium]
MINRLLMAALVALALPISAHAQSQSAIDAQKGQDMMQAFTCHHMMRLMFVDKTKELSQRFYKIGLRLGRDHLEALFAGRITEEDRRAIIPAVILQVPDDQGMNFVLGAMYQLSKEVAFKKIEEQLGGDFYDFRKSQRNRVINNLFDAQIFQAPTCDGILRAN